MSIDQFLLSADTTDLNYPEVRPTLDLNFARTKTLDPRITFTRASGGTYVGADGLIKYAGVNEARFDHDPVTGESLGLLIEEGRTNLLPRSEEFNTASWAKIFATASANVISAPDGTTTADKLEETSGTGEHFFYQGRAGSNETVTLSVFCKQAERTRVRIGFSNFVTEGKGAIYDLISGSVVLTEASGTDYTNLNASISSFGNGWYRCVFTATKGAVNTTNNPFVETVTGTLASFAGTTGSGVYLWGAQLEAGPNPTSYIPTQASTRTRARDTPQIIGRNFSSFYNQQNSTLFFSGRSPGTQTPARLFGGIVDSSVGFISSIYFNIGGSPLIVSWSPISGFGALANYIPNTEIKGILTYTTTEPTATACLNGGSVLSAFNRIFSFGGQTIFGFSKTMNRLTIGLSPWGFDAVLNGTISRIIYFPKRLPNAQLQALTR